MDVVEPYSSLQLIEKVIDVHSRFTIPALYAFAAMELVISLLTGSPVMTVIVIIFTGMAMSLRGFKMYQEREELPIASRKVNDWEKTRSLLERLLVSGKILPVSSSAGEITDIQIIDDVSQLTASTSVLNADYIKKLRTMGIDGLLIALFLLQEYPSFCSVKVIQKMLNIPLSTIYRVVQKLEENDFVANQYILGSPNKAYYRITQEGESVVLELYQFLGGHDFLYTRESEDLGEKLSF